MSISHILESFDGALDGEHSISMTEVTLEEQKLEAFERGYQAGWDDAVKAQAEERDHISSEFANNLKELSLTYSEAYGHMVGALKPLLTRIVDTLLPAMARESLAPQIVEQLDELAGVAGKPPVEVVVSPGNASAVRKLAAHRGDMPLEIVEEPTLGEGQAYLRFADAERQIDYEDVLSGIARSVEAFFHEIEHNMEKEPKDER